MAAKKIFILLLLGGCLLTLLLIRMPIRPVVAVEPTPTPTNPLDAQSSPGETLCHLASGETCALVNSLDQAAFEVSASRHINPAWGAQAVPTDTLISATFDREMDPTSFTPETFYVTQTGGQRITGSLDYIETSQVAVFTPDAPLQPATDYTVTVAPEVRESSGLPLGASRVWTFTTTAAISTLAADDLLAQSGMGVYFGDLHSHTGFTDGKGTPAQAFATARANGLDFFAVTEHCFMLTPFEWGALKDQANAATISGQFVALPGFEYTHQYGHLNVFASDTYVHRNDPNYDTLAEFYNWLIAHPTAFAQFNHPTKDATRDMNFNNFAYNPQADLKIVLQDLQTADQFFLSMNKGWHLGSLKNHDTHWTNWGCCPWMGAVASSLTKEGILEALRNRRTFFVSPSDSNLALVMQANGYWMGSAIPNTTKLNFTINVYDPDPKGQWLNVAIYDNGVRVASASLPSKTVYTWKPTVTGKQGHYYYAEAYYSGFLYPAYSSPIWVEYPPIAEASSAQFMAPGATISLNGLASRDPDGDALAYRWTQDSGPGGSLNNPASSQPLFTAPSTVGNAVLRLTVTDPGGLSAADTTTITITDAPILAIGKSGPVQTEPGELINYTLMVVNFGATPASNVLITDVVPAGATYISGGSLQPGNIVSWNVPNLAPNGGTAQVSFAVAATQPLVNSTYGASCPGCIPAIGNVSVYTNGRKNYLPVIVKN